MKAPSGGLSLGLDLVRALSQSSRPVPTGTLSGQETGGVLLRRVLSRWGSWTLNHVFVEITKTSTVMVRRLRTNGEIWVGYGGREPFGRLGEGQVSRRGRGVTRE